MRFLIRPAQQDDVSAIAAVMRATILKQTRLKSLNLPVGI